MLDLCAGLGGASQAMRRRGWAVITVDNDPRFGCTVTGDLRSYTYVGPRPDLIWASPPCTEFTREFLPWWRTGMDPDLSLVQACRRVIAEARPRYWVIENVRGSSRWLRPMLGPPRQIIGPWFLWGTLPPLGVSLRGVKRKSLYSSRQAAERAMIPAGLSMAVALAVEGQGQLFEVAP